MTFPDKLKDLLEETIERNFQSLIIDRPPLYTDTVEFNPTFVGDNTFAPHGAKQQRHKFDYQSPVVVFSYPTDGITAISFNGQYIRKSAPSLIDFNRTDETPDSSDLVNDANIVEIEFLPDNPFEYIEVYTSLNSPTTTSRLKLTLFDKSEVVIGRVTLFNSDILDGGWIKIPLGTKWFDVDLPGNFKLKIEEFESGSNSDGINVWKNSIAEHLIRTYYKKISKKYGSVRECIMRFDIFSKSKNIGIGNEPTKFVPGDVIASEFARQIRNHIVQYWYNIQSDPNFNPDDVQNIDAFGFHELRGGGSDADFMRTEVIYHNWFDVALYYEDGYVKEAEPLRKIIIEKVTLTKELI